MEQTQISINEIYHRLIALEKALKLKGILDKDSIALDDEGELTDEFKAELERRRKSKNYISHEEVKRRILGRK